MEGVVNSKGSQWSMNIVGRVFMFQHIQNSLPFLCTTNTVENYGLIDTQMINWQEMHTKMMQGAMDFRCTIQDPATSAAMPISLLSEVRCVGLYNRPQKCDLKEIYTIFACPSLGNALDNEFSHVSHSGREAGDSVVNVNTRYPRRFNSSEMRHPPDYTQLLTSLEQFLEDQS